MLPDPHAGKSQLSQHGWVGGWVEGNKDNICGHENEGKTLEFMNFTPLGGKAKQDGDL